MFIFSKSIKESLVTVGVSLSCGLFVADAIREIYRGMIYRTIGSFVFALFLLVLAAAVLWGNKLGYLVIRYIWRGVAFVSLLGGALNPIAYMDFGPALRCLPCFIGVCLLVSFSAFCVSYCLCEHAKLRNLEGVQKWRSFP